jgi:uncharacterized membrane protein YtjA (UPF0391 family)
MIKEFAKEVPARVKAYTREHWSASFIVGLMLILVVATVSLSMGSTGLANEGAIFASLSFIVGSVLQLVCFIKYSKRNGEKKYESN